MAVWQIRKGKEVLCEGHIKNLGYKPETIKEMAKVGLYLYKDGKRVKPCELE